MICSNIKLTGPAESIAIDALTIHEWNQRDSRKTMQRRLETLADANPARGTPPAVHRFPKTTGSPTARLRERFKPKRRNRDLGFDRRRQRSDRSNPSFPVQSFALRKRFAFVAGNDEEERNAFRRGAEDNRRPAVRACRVPAMPPLMEGRR